MPRSVVLKGSPRCERCRCVKRWCICEGLRELECPLQIDVLMHHREIHRPTSTGHLIDRVIPSARLHLYRRERPLDRAAIVQPGKTLWILHPFGDPLPAEAFVSEIQVLLLDGAWGETSGMLRAVQSWGRPVRLPMLGESRYWLRSQQGEGQFSTVEALLFLLEALGLEQTRDELRLQFELHVYAGLCTRGKKREAAEYLRASPLRSALPELLRRLVPNE